MLAASASTMLARCAAVAGTAAGAVALAPATP
jgi:hypothetical protein